MAVLLAVSIPVAAHAETLREQSHGTAELSGVSKVVAQNARGRIEVRPSPDRSLHLTAVKIVRAMEASVARRLADETRVELARQGPRYTIRVRYPGAQSVRINLWRGFNELTVPRVEVRLSLEVPAGVAVDLEGASADLFGENLAAPLTLKSASGDAGSEGCTGDVLATTASGDVTIAGARAAWVSTASGDVEIGGTRGPVRVTTSSGDVQIAEMSDSLRVETVSGDISVARAPAGASIGTTSGEIRVRRAAGRVHASSASGDIRVMLEPPLREAQITTSSGDVGLGLADHVGCSIEMRTSSGSLDLGLPCRTRTITRQLVTAVVGEGVAPVVLRTASGNITVTRGEP
jgi:DUF4097 and DUF4098 domain-containing protein YvlB